MQGLARSGVLIISHRHRFIFFAQPRTGTHAIRAALQPHLGEGDWQQQALRGSERLPVAALARIGHGHISLRQAQACLPEEISSGYFKFALARNPYDRLVSACCFLNRRNPSFAGSEASFMKQALGSASFRQRALIRPQTDLLMDEAGAMGMDFVGRYEQLQASFDEACQSIGLPPTPLARLNASQHAHYPSYYDAELLDMATAFYRRDLHWLGYPEVAHPEAWPCA